MIKEIRKMKNFSLVLLLIVVLTFGCAKPNEPNINNILEIEQIYPTTGYAKDFYLSENMIFVAQDDVGFILFDRNIGNTLGEKRGYQTKYITASEQDSLLVIFEDIEHNFHVYDFTNLDSIFEITLSGIKEDYSRYPKLHYVSSNRDTFKLNFLKNNQLKRVTYKLDGIWGWEPIENEDITFPEEYHCLKHYEIQNDTIYLAVGQLGFSISNTLSQILCEVDTTILHGEVLTVKVVDNYAFVTCKEEGFAIINISNMENPIMIFSDDTSGWAQSIDVEGDYLVVGSGGGGVYLYDISNAENPQFLDRIDDNEIGYTYKVVIENEQIFAATKRGIYKLKMNSL